jgi:SAM-dependent methyltransferase
MSPTVPAKCEPEKSKDRKLSVWVTRLTREVLDFEKLALGTLRYFEYLSDLRKYRSLSKNERVPLSDVYPILHDKRSSHPFDRHYFYQDWWAFGKVARAKPKEHVDVGSNLVYACLLSNVVPVKYVDLRALEASIPTLKFVQGDILNLPFPDNSIESLSCLHVIEHIGLGRYSDRLDPDGSRKACKELARVLAPGGSLYLGLPVGHERVCFNAHRVHSPRTVLSYLQDLELLEFSGVNDRGEFMRNIAPELLSDCDYGCGLYWFTRR